MGDALSFNGGTPIKLPTLDGGDSGGAGVCYGAPACAVAGSGNSPLDCCNAIGGCCSGSNNLWCCESASNSNKTKQPDSSDSSDSSSGNSAASMSVSVLSIMTVVAVVSTLGM